MGAPLVAPVRRCRLSWRCVGRAAARATPAAAAAVEVQPAAAAAVEVQPSPMPKPSPVVLAPAGAGAVLGAATDGGGAVSSSVASQRSRTLLHRERPGEMVSSTV